MKILRKNIFSPCFSSITLLHRHLLLVLTFSRVVLSIWSLTHEHSRILNVITRLSLGLAAQLCQKISWIYILASNDSFWREPISLCRVGMCWWRVMVKFPWAFNKASEGLRFMLLFLCIRNLLLYTCDGQKKYCFPDLTADQQYEVTQLGQQK